MPSAACDEEGSDEGSDGSDRYVEFLSGEQGKEKML